MSDTIRLVSDAGQGIRALRKEKGMSVTALARLTGKSRDTLHRLENGEDVSLGTFLAVLAGLGYGVTLTRAGIPTLEEMKRRFANDNDDDS